MGTTRRFAASDIADYFRPSECPLRFYLRSQGVRESPPSPFGLYLRRLSKAHEIRHLRGLAEVVDLSGIPNREERTVAAICGRAPAIYKGCLRAVAYLGGKSCEIVGSPDVLILRGNRYVVREAVLARRVGRGRHREVELQLQVLGWLYEQRLGVAPAGLEVYAGDGGLVSVAYDGGTEALTFLEYLHEIRGSPREFYEPVGWGKCKRCCYLDRCWRRAKASDDVSLLPGVNQQLARALRARGVIAVYDLRRLISDPAFRDLLFDGQLESVRTLRKAWQRILWDVEAHSTGKALVIASPAIPEARSFAMLDLEGVPAVMNRPEMVHLWGIKVFGERESPYLAAQAGCGEGSDRAAWLTFLRLAKGFRYQHGELPFVHWGSYEREKLDLYIQRYGDSESCAAWVRRMLLDLYSLFRGSVVLPAPSYGLKAVERHVGFQRHYPDRNGEWVIARYTEALETDSGLARSQMLAEIRAYNEEDLDATWAVLSWLRSAPVTTR